MQFLGIIMALAMTGSCLLEWQAATDGPVLIEVHYFLGIEHDVFFTIFGQQVDSLPIILAPVLLLAMVLAKFSLGRYVALSAGLLGLVVSIRDICHLFPIEGLRPGLGLWIYAVASALAVVSVIVMLRRPTPASVSAVTPTPAS